MCEMVDNATYGVEVEFYEDTCADIVVGDLGVADKITTDYDGSLGGGGREIKFSRGVTKEELNDYLLQARAVLARSVDYYVANTDHSDECTYTGKHDVEARERGGTGLHVHFGLNKPYLFLDVFRLAILCAKRYETISSLGWRKDDQWASDYKGKLNWVKRNIEYAFENDGRFSANYICADKDYGFNPCGWDDRNTVEFRYAHASLIENEVHFNEYVKYIDSLVAQSFTGEKVLEWEGLKFEELTESGSFGTRRLKITKGNNTRLWNVEK
jgi:hypothetical protein